MTLAVMIYAATMQTVAVLLLVVQSRFMWRADIRGEAANLFEMVEEEGPEGFQPGGLPDVAQLHEVMKSARLVPEDFSGARQSFYNGNGYL